MNDVDALVTEIGTERNAPDGVACLIQSFVMQLAAAGTDAAKLTALGANIHDKSPQLVAAVFAGTQVPPATTGIMSQADADAMASAAVARRANFRQYEGKNVEVLRGAGPSDRGYDTKEGPQSLVKLADGTHKVVLTEHVQAHGGPDDGRRGPDDGRRGDGRSGPDDGRRGDGRSGPDDGRRGPDDGRRGDGRSGPDDGRRGDGRSGPDDGRRDWSAPTGAPTPGGTDPRTWRGDGSGNKEGPVTPASAPYASPASKDQQPPPTGSRTYQGKQIVVVRDATSGDTGYDAAKGPQKIVRYADGTEGIVLQKDVT